MAPVDILLFVEDPGAANFALPIPDALFTNGFSYCLIGDGLAVPYLRDRGINVVLAAEFASVEKIIQYFQPKLIMVGTSENEDSLGLALIETGNKMGVCTVGLLDASVNAEYRFRGRTSNSLAFVPDWLLVPDDSTKDAFMALSYPEERIVLSGHPHYDIVRAAGVQFALEANSLRQHWLPRQALGRPLVVFVAEVSTGLHSQQYRLSPDYTLFGWGNRQGRTEIVVEEFLNAAKSLNSNPYLILRLHPKNTREEFAPYIKEFDMISSGGAPLELIYLADLVVGMTSMLLLEAVLLGKKTLSIVPREIEKSWLLTIQAGFTRCATSPSEIKKYLEKLINSDLDLSGAQSYFPSNSTNNVIRFVKDRLDGVRLK